MSTNYPGALDNYQRPAQNDTMATTGVQGDVVAGNIYDSIEALEEKVGVDSSTDTSSLTYKIESAVEPGHSHSASSLPDATTSAQGVVELATSAEAITGTDTDRAVTPAALQAAIDDELTSLDAFLIDGWISATSETWTYASATTFTISGDKTTKYRVGHKIKFTQTTVKYFIITACTYSAPNTTVTVTGGTDYTIANAAIGSNYYTFASVPFGFPRKFAYTPTGTNFTLGSGTYTFEFRVEGTTCFLDGNVALSGSTMGTAPTFTLPITANVGAANTCDGPAHFRDAGVASYHNHMARITGGAPTVVELSEASGSNTTITSTAPFTWGNGDSINFSIAYPI